MVFETTKDELAKEPTIEASHMVGTAAPSDPDATTNKTLAAEAPGGSRRGGLMGFFVVALVLSVLAGLAVGLPDYLPTNDGPSHIFGSFAARHLDGDLGYSRYLKLGTSFSQLGFGQLFGFWEVFLSWRGALRVSLVTMVLLWAWGVVALAAAVGGRKALWLGLLGFAAAAQWQLYMGLFHFYLATGFGFYVIALALWRPQPSLRWNLLLATALLCQALFHPVPALCSALVIVLLAVAQRPQGNVLAWAGRLGLVLAPTALIILATAIPDGGGVAYDAMPLSQRAHIAVSAFVSGPLWRSWGLPACAILGLAFAVGQGQWRNDRRRGALLLAGLLFALLATLGPFHLSGWQFFNMRFSAMAAVLLALLLPLDRWRAWIRGTCVALLVLYATGSNLWALSTNTRLRRASDDLLSGLDAPIRRHGIRLPLILEPRAGEVQDKASRTFPYYTANWNVGAIFAVQQGGVPAWTLAGNELRHPVVWRWPDRQGLRPPAPERGFEWSLSEPRVLATPGLRKAEVNYLLSFAPYYEDVIFYGRPDEVEWLRERRFQIDYQHGGLAIARFQACPAVLEIAPGTQGHAKAIVQFGWAPSTDVTLSVTLPAEPEAQGPRRWTVPECPCGEVWFRVLFDNDGDGRLSAGDSMCMEADARGVVLARIDPSANQVACRVGPRWNLPKPPGGL